MSGKHLSLMIDDELRDRLQAAAVERSAPERPNLSATVRDLLRVSVGLEPISPDFAPASTPKVARKKVKKSRN